MLNDPLANVMSFISNYESIGKSECVIKPSSNIIKKVLSVIKEKGFITSFEEIKDGRGNYLKINLNGSINKCGVIKPRYNIKANEFEKFERRYLPAKDVGILIMSTQKGITTHYDAKSKKIGGRLLAYCY